MANVNALISQRLKKSETPSSKMAAMAQQSASGNLSSFNGVFGVAELSQSEKDAIENILREYAEESSNVQHDLKALISIASEVKAINNQAAILHGERIKKAHDIFIKYKEGAFSAWLIAAYGNRQTPYNLMQYYEFYEALPKTLRPQLELMPRQAVYTLASREGPLDIKRKLVEDYAGQTKAELLILIREQFPLAESDKRGRHPVEGVIQALNKVCITLERKSVKLTKGHKSTLKDLISTLQELVENN